MKIAIEERSICYCELNDEIIEKEFLEWIDEDLEKLSKEDLKIARDEFLSEYIYDHITELTSDGRYVDGDCDWWIRE